MDSMLDTLFSYSSFWLWFAFAIILVIIGVLVLLSGLVRQSAKDAGTNLASLLEEDTGEDGAEGEGAGATAGSAPATARLRTQGASASFRQAVGFLRSTIGGSDFRYHIPWYLMAGDPGSGKYSLMTGVGANVSQETRRRDPASLVNWHFLDGGVLLGLAGKCWKAGPSRRDWSATLRLLRNHRPRRPIDGVVLTIAAPDLVGPDALSEAFLTATATRYSEMFSQAQRAFGFTFPVYVVVTKCDEIEGFSEFCRELPPKNRDSIFGWSSPYHLDAAFSPDWVDEAFENVTRDLQRLQSEIFVERSKLEDPERLFLFPENLAQLRSPLYLYLDRLFRETSYREAFRFRGIYFSGDPSEPAPPLAAAIRSAGSDSEHPAGEEIAPPDLAAGSALKRRKPAFVRELFEKKIFAEVGVARPLSSVFLIKNRAARAIQVAAVVLGIVLASGTIAAYHRMALNRDLLYQPLLEMYTQRVDTNGLLQELYAADRVSFSSAFIPASYVSRIDTDVTDVMRRATETWIMGALQKRLMTKKVGLFTVAPPNPAQPIVTPASGTDSQPGDGPAPPLVANVNQTSEFRELQDYHEKLKSFQEYVDVYEQIRKTGKPGDLTRIQHLLDYLGLNQVQPHEHLLVALSTSSGPPVTVTPDESRFAVEKIDNLVDGMFENWSENNALVAHADRLRQAAGSLEQGSTGQLVQRLRTARDSLHVVEVDLASPDFRWAFGNTLVFDDTVRKNLSNPLESGNTAILQSAQSNGQKYLEGIRMRLFDERTTMTDHLFAVDPFGLSPRVGDLRLALENVLNLRFMTEIPVVRPIQIALPANRRLMWRIEPLQEALRLHDIYVQFVRDGSRGMFDSLRVPLSRVALEQMKRHVEDLIAESQETQNRPPPGQGVGLDDETLPEVNSFREAAGILQQLAERFQTDGIEIRNSILRIMVLQSYNLLAILDRRLDELNPYAIKEGNWTGKGAMSLAMFDVRNTAALNDYLGTQRDNLAFLEKQAESLVPFLNQYLPVRPEAQNRLITKWQSIVEDYHQFETKRPNAALTSLQDFVINEMDRISENACSVPGLLPDESQDFFLQKRNALRRSAVERCRDVSAVSVCNSYGRIADVFNSTLASKFPFAPIAGKVQAEATPEAIRAFFAEVQRQGKSTRTLLEQDARFGDAAAKAIEFLSEIEALRPLVDPPGTDVAKEPALSLAFLPQFRTNRASEIGGNQIVQWDLQVGGQIEEQRQEHEITWRPGNPVRLSLRWANESALLPVADGQPDLRVIQRNAYFEFTDRWSLLAFLRRHEAPPEDAEALPYTLRFNVKTARDEKWTGGDNVPAPGTATVYLQMRLSAPGSKTPLRLPVFPVAAPALTSACEKE